MTDAKTDLMSDLIPIRRALISVSDKTDLLPFARRLHALGATLISTGGTAKALADAGLPVTPIDALTGFPEMMDGRLKTLHPRVHGGLLALRDDPDHVAAMRQHGIEPIDLVCVNLYPFEKTIERPGVAEHEAIEQIDIGGPSMVRSASKNFRFVTVVTGPAQYDRVVNELTLHRGATTLALRRELAAAAFARTAQYDTTIAQWMARTDGQAFPESLTLRYHRAATLRYGENPHQRGALYTDPAWRGPSVATARQLHGKELSFCNLYDADGALNLVRDALPHTAAAVIKHANPCGFALADTLERAFDRAYHGDPLAAYGGIVALTHRVDAATATRMVEGQKFLEVVIAPGYDADALALLADRWKHVRLLETGELTPPPHGPEHKFITGGLLVHDRDTGDFNQNQWRHVAGPAPSPERLREMLTATLVVKHLKSNAVCLVRENALVGAGAGQMDRVAACSMALHKAGDRARGATVGSDAFFPFRDGPDLLIAAGVAAIAQPGGSKRDDDTIAACHDAGVTLVFTGQRHFRH